MLLAFDPFAEALGFLLRPPPHRSRSILTAALLHCLLDSDDECRRDDVRVPQMYVPRRPPTPSRERDGPYARSKIQVNATRSVLNSHDAVVMRMHAHP